MSRTSLISSRRFRALRERPATDTRLPPYPFPHSGDGRSIDSTRHTCLPGHSRSYAPFLGRPDSVGSPEAITPRVYSPVVSLGIPLSHGDGQESTHDPLRTVESVWGSSPPPDSPVVPLGEPLSPGNGRESAPPSLRMVQRFPPTDSPQRETPSRPVDSRVWRRLASQPTRPGHGPSIACSSPPRPLFALSFRCPARNLGRGLPLRRSGPRAGILASPSVIPNPDRESIPAPHPSFLRRQECGFTFQVQHAI